MGLTYHHPSLPGKVFGSLLTDNSHKNVQIATADGTVVLAHSAVLAAVSDKFRPMFSSVNFGIYKLTTPGITASQWEVLLQLIHTGRVGPLPPGFRVDRLRDVSDKLEMHDISQFFQEQEQTKQEHKQEQVEIESYRGNWTFETVGRDGRGSVSGDSDQVTSSQMTPEKSMANMRRSGVVTDLSPAAAMVFQNGDGLASDNEAPQARSDATPQEMVSLNGDTLAAPDSMLDHVSNSVIPQVSPKKETPTQNVDAPMSDKDLGINNTEDDVICIDDSSDDEVIVDDKEDDDIMIKEENFAKVVIKQEKQDDLVIACSNPRTDTTEVNIDFGNTTEDTTDDPPSPSPSPEYDATTDTAESSAFNLARVKVEPDLQKLMMSKKLIDKSRRKHQEQTFMKLTCDECGFKSTSVFTAAGHLSSAHGHSKCYKCSRCAKSFPTHTALCCHAKYKCFKGVEKKISVKREKVWDEVEIDQDGDGKDEDQGQNAEGSSENTEEMNRANSAGAKVQRQTEGFTHHKTKYPMMEKTCRTCGRVSQTMAAAARHLKNVHQIRNCYVCKVCQRSYNSYPGLLHHFKSTCSKTQQHVPTASQHLTIQDLVEEKCEHCNHVSSFVPDAAEHLKTAHGVEKCFICKWCQSSFEDMGSLVGHVVSNCRQYTLKRCSNENTTRTPSKKRGRRETTHFVDKTCKICDHVSLCSTDAGEHLRNVHKLTKCFICKICQKGYESYRGVYQHAKLTHQTNASSETIEPSQNEIQNYESNMRKTPSPKLPERKTRGYAAHKMMDKTCHFCGQISPSISIAAQHLRVIHKVEKNFICIKCGKGLASYGSLLQHFIRFCLNLSKVAPAPVATGSETLDQNMDQNIADSAGLEANDSRIAPITGSKSVGLTRSVSAGSSEHEDNPGMLPLIPDEHHSHMSVSTDAQGIQNQNNSTAPNVMERPDQNTGTLSNFEAVNGIPDQTETSEDSMPNQDNQARNSGVLQEINAEELKKKSHFLCMSCGKELPSAQMLFQHYSRCSAKAPVQLPKENKEWPILSNLSSCICEICDLEFACEKDTIDHIKYVHPARDEPIDTGKKRPRSCNYESEKDPKLSKSDDQNEDDGDDLMHLRCNLCGEESANIILAALHRRSKHNMSDCYCCRYCDKGFQTHKELLIHSEYHCDNLTNAIISATTPTEDKEISYDGSGRTSTSSVPLPMSNDCESTSNESRSRPLSRDQMDRPNSASNPPRSSSVSSHLGELLFESSSQTGSRPNSRNLPTSVNDMDQRNPHLSAMQRNQASNSPVSTNSPHFFAPNQPDPTKHLQNQDVLRNMQQAPNHVNPYLPANFNPAFPAMNHTIHHRPAYSNLQGDASSRNTFSPNLPSRPLYGTYQHQVSQGQPLDPASQFFNQRINQSNNFANELPAGDKNASNSRGTDINRNIDHGGQSDGGRGVSPHGPMRMDSNWK